MTLALRFRIIHEKNFQLSMEMSFFAMPLAPTWLARHEFV